MDEPQISYTGEYKDVGETEFRNDSKFLKLIVPVGFLVMLIVGLMIGVSNIDKTDRIQTKAAGLTP